MAVARCIVLILIGAAAGCRSMEPYDVVGSSAGTERDWFCERSANGHWNCIERTAARFDRQPPKSNATVARQADTVQEIKRTPTPAPALPPHLRLAYRTDGPVALTDLPAHFYAVQLMASSSLSSLKRFSTEKGLSNMTAAPIERDGELLYVLLAGIYENREIANRAAALLPDNLRAEAPWVRALGPLQNAMRRAEDLLAGAK